MMHILLHKHNNIVINMFPALNAAGVMGFFFCGKNVQGI